jgi:dolichyl-phosphate beta-glucosyltransferase
MPVVLSLVIPAYNESQRLPRFLASVREYFARGRWPSHEVIVVDDGSTDGLAAVLSEEAAHNPSLRVLTHMLNRGKGAAVRTGMLAAKGGLLLFADADGATPIDQADRLAEAIAAGNDVAVGSRYVEDQSVCRRRTPLRGLAGRVFAWLARRTLGVPVRDPQCGFKMFTAAAAKDLFSSATENGYLFDLEILQLAKRRGLRIAEVAVEWRAMPGGHLHLAREIWRVPRDLYRLRRRLKKA